MEAFVVVWIICGAIGLAIGNGKGKPLAGFLLGLLLGVIGLIIIAVMKPTPEAEAARNVKVAETMRVLEGQGQEASLVPCPWCAERIQPNAQFCRFCGKEVGATAT